MLILYNFHISWNIFIFFFSSKLIKNVKTILTIQKQMVNWVWPMDHSRPFTWLVHGTWKCHLSGLTSCFSLPYSLPSSHLSVLQIHQAFSCLWAIAFALLLPETSCPWMFPWLISFSTIILGLSSNVKSSQRSFLIPLSPSGHPTPRCPQHPGYGPILPVRLVVALD